MSSHTNLDTSKFTNACKEHDRKLRTEQGYGEGKVTGEVVKGGRVFKRVEHRKNEDMKWGFIPHIFAGIARGIAGIASADQRAKAIESFKEGWKELTEEKSVIGERTRRAVLGVILFLLNVSADFRGFTLGAAAEGADVKKSFAEEIIDPDSIPRITDKQKDDIEEEYPGCLRHIANHELDGAPKLTEQEADEILRVQYTPTRDSSVRALFDPANPRAQANRMKLVEAHGHYFMTEERRDGRTSFIFVPNCDFSKATSYNIAYTKNGAPICNHDALLRYVDDFCAAYGEINEKWEKEAYKIALRIATQDPDKDENDEEYLKELTRKVIESRGAIVLSPKGEHVRIYSKGADPNTVNTNSYFSGVLIDLSGGAKKQWKDNHNSNRSEYKKDLEGNKPFANPVSLPNTTNQQNQYEPPDLDNGPIIEEVDEMDEMD